MKEGIQLTFPKDGSGGGPGSSSNNQDNNNTTTDKRRFFGTIKSFNANKGFGFVACEVLYRKYASDIFLHKQQLGNHEVGDNVWFSLVFKNLQPQAGDLVREDMEGVNASGGGHGSPSSGPQSPKNNVNITNTNIS